MSNIFCIKMVESDTKLISYTYRPKFYSRFRIPKLSTPKLLILFSLKSNFILFMKLIFIIK